MSQLEGKFIYAGAEWSRSTVERGMESKSNPLPTLAADPGELSSVA